MKKEVKVNPFKAEDKMLTTELSIAWKNEYPFSSVVFKQKHNVVSVNQDFWALSFPAHFQIHKYSAANQITFLTSPSSLTLKSFILCYHNYCHSFP